jgi:excisionase family DNA binding protein
MMSLGEVCRVLGVSQNTLRRWDKKGLIATERTPGGQRRFPVAEVHRLLRQRAQVEQNDRPVKVAPQAVPQAALAQTAAAVRTSKDRLVRMGDAFYQWNDVPKGYFASDDGNRGIEDVIDFLERDLKRGDFERTVGAVRELAARAVRNGVSIIECFRFWELLTDAIVAAAAPVLRAANGQAESKPLHSLIRALTHSYLDEIDNPENMIGGRS